LKWPDRNIVVYPAVGGQIVLYDVNKRKVRTWDAHQGGCCATFFAEGLLHTLGGTDGLMRVWTARGAKVGQCLAPNGVIAAEAASNGNEVIVVTADGRAGTYERESDALRLKAALAGQDYRVLKGPPAEVRSRVAEEQRQERGRELCGQIQERLNAGETHGLDSLHQGLVDLGFKTISFRLQADQAEREHNAVAELAARHALAQLLPAAQPQAATSLLRYAECLARVWLLRDALTVMEKVKTAGANAAPSEWLMKTAKSMKREEWAADPDLPIGNLIEAATVVGRPLSGRWVLSRFDPVPFPERRLLAAELVGKYEQVQQEDGRPGLPSARLQKMCWLSRSMPVIIETVLLAGSPNQVTEGAELAVQFLYDGVQTILAPYLLLNAGERKAPSSSSQHNQWVAETLGRITGGNEIDHWLDAVRRTLTHAIRRLRTETICRAPSA
jgi:hypothetical protein